jgi:hypothetical protein
VDTTAAFDKLSNVLKEILGSEEISMKSDFKARIAISAAAGAMLALMAMPAAAQDGDGGPRRQVPAGKTPRAADGKPDLSGVWSPEHTFIYDISVSLAKGDSIATLGGKID